MAETMELAVKLAELSANQQEILRRLDYMDEARRRDREEDQKFNAMLQESNTRITRLEERNNLLMKLFYGALGPGVAGAGMGVHYLFNANHLLGG